MYVCMYVHTHIWYICIWIAVARHFTHLARTPTPYSTLSHLPQYLPHMFFFAYTVFHFFVSSSSYGPNGGSCTACPTAKPFSQKGSTSSDACISTCPAGFTGSVPCTACPAGKYKVFSSHTSTPTISHYHVLTWPEIRNRSQRAHITGSISYFRSSEYEIDLFRIYFVLTWPEIRNRSCDVCPLRSRQRVCEWGGVYACVRESPHTCAQGTHHRLLVVAVCCSCCIM